MEIIKRLKAETPPFFKKVQVFGGSLMTAGIGVLGAPKVLPEGIAMPEIVTHYAGQSIVIGFVMGLVAQCAMKNVAEVTTATPTEEAAK